MTGPSGSHPFGRDDCVVWHRPQNAQSVVPGVTYVNRPVPAIAAQLVEKNDLCRVFFDMTHTFTASGPKSCGPRAETGCKAHVVSVTKLVGAAVVGARVATSAWRETILSASVVRSERAASGILSVDGFLLLFDGADVIACSYADDTEVRYLCVIRM